MSLQALLRSHDPWGIGPGNWPLHRWAQTTRASRRRLRLTWRGMMADEQKRKNPKETQAQATDAIRHVGKTLESEGTFLPTGELPENRIEAEGLTDSVNMNAVTADEWDREADAMGAERLKTRLPGDISSDPHDGVEIDVEPARSGKRRGAA